MSSHVHCLYIEIFWNNNFVSVCDNFVDALNVMSCVCVVFYLYVKVLSVVVKEEHQLYWQRDVSDCMRVEVNY